jgi:chaperone required for assembly of F1-ATPase
LHADSDGHPSRADKVTQVSGEKDGVERPRRFWKTVTTEATDGGFAVRLDGRSPRSPGGRPLVLPTQALADLIAGEWAAQGEFVDMTAMPATRLAYTALEKVPAAREAVAEEVAKYAGSDLVCYFADGPVELIVEQKAAWNPLLDWAADLGVMLEPATGIVHRPQSPESLARVRNLALELDDFGLAGLAHAAGLFGSAVIALALQRGLITGQDAHDRARLDEAFQERQWGVDTEAAARTANRLREALWLERWFAAAGRDS